MAFATLLVRSRHRLSQIQGRGHTREAGVSWCSVLARVDQLPARRPFLSQEVPVSGAGVTSGTQSRIRCSLPLGLPSPAPIFQRS